jgi:hypothetical protein
MATGSRKQDYDGQKDDRKTIFDEEYRTPNEEESPKEINLSQTSDAYTKGCSSPFWR